MNELTNMKNGNDAIRANELQIIANKLNNYLEKENDRILEEIAEVVNKQPTLLERLFPSHLQRETNMLTVKKMKMLYEDKEMFFKFYSDVKLEVAKLYGNALIVGTGMELQAHIAKLYKEKMEDLTKTIIESRERFLEKMKPHYLNIQQYKDIAELYEPAYLSYKNHCKIYIQSIDEVLEGFIDSLKSKVASIKKV